MRNTMRWGTIAAGVALALMVWLTNSANTQIAAAGGISLNELLNRDGTLNLTTGRAGTVDVKGWNVTLDPLRGPVFGTTASAAPAAPPFSSWSPLIYGVSGKVNALAVSGSDVYLGGEFAQICGNATCDIGNTPAHSIAHFFNGSGWNGLGYGMNGWVTSIAARGGMCMWAEVSSISATVSHAATTIPSLS